MTGSPSNPIPELGVSPRRVERGGSGFTPRARFHQFVQGFGRQAVSPIGEPIHARRTPDIHRRYFPIGACQGSISDGLQDLIAAKQFRPSSSRSNR